MAYQIFAEGKDTNWEHVYYKIEYETIRSGSKVGIRWKITWTIDNNWYFGYNIVADVWTEGENIGRQIKANSPNRGSGSAIFPENGDYYWFDKGYSNNDVTGCRVIMKCTNGGTIPFDTGVDRTLVAPTGYTFSSLINNLNFNIGNNIPILINDVTNQAYNYKLYLDVFNESNQWQNVKVYETSSKNFTLDISDITATLYSLLPTRNKAPVRLRLETRMNEELLGTFIKEGECNVVDSNPDLPIFNLIYFDDWFNENQIGLIRKGYSVYNPYSQTWIRIRMPQNLVGKNGATLIKYIFKGGNYSTDLTIDTIIPQSGGGINGDVNSQYDQVEVEAEFGEGVYNSFYSLTIVDSRGNQTTRSFNCTVDYFIPPYFTKSELKRVDGISNVVKFNAEGKYLHAYEGNTKPIIKYMSNYATGGDQDDWHEIPESYIVMTGDGTFKIENYTLLPDYHSFDVNKDYITRFSLYIPPMPEYAPNYQDVFLSKGKPLEYYSKNGVSYGDKYNETAGGPLQVNGLAVCGFEIIETW